MKPLQPQRVKDERVQPDVTKSRKACYTRMSMSPEDPAVDGSRQMLQYVYRFCERLFVVVVGCVAG